MGIVRKVVVMNGLGASNAVAHERKGVLLWV